MGTDFSIITDSSSSLQISITGSRLEVLGFSHGRRVSITEEYGRITISLITDSQQLQTVEPVTAEVPPVVEPEPVAEVQTEVVPELVPEVIPASGSHTDILEPQILLFQRLAGLRKQIALEFKVPAYVIFHDKTLQEIARVAPADLESLGKIAGVGAARLQRYGSRFLEVIRQHSQG